MKIVYLAAGAGPMYCGSCLHSNTLCAALRAAGEDAMLVPVYTPLRADEENMGIKRVAFGGINVWLQQRWSVFRHTPRLFDRWLDHPALLRWVSRGGSITRAEQLGSLTVSMLRGEQGRQRKELEKLADWLQREHRPDVVHLSSALLVGVARQLARRLAVQVVCTLSGEDVFLEKLPQPHYDQARAILRERCADLAALVAMNSDYADFMAEYLAVPRERIRVIRPGLNLVGHGTRLPQIASRRPLTIGYLGRICPEKGLHLLVDALKLLCDDPNMPPVELRVAGYLDRADRPYLENLRSRLADRGLGDRFRYAGELDRPAKIAFLQSLYLMSVPAICRESKALPVLEAWANAVPVVLPNQGTFAELVEDTGGGLLCEPNDPAALAAALKRMIQDPDLAAECGRCGQQAIRERYDAPRMARQMVALYEDVCGGRPARA